MEYGKLVEIFVWVGREESSLMSPAPELIGVGHGKGQDPTPEEADLRCSHRHGYREVKTYPSCSNRSLLKMGLKLRGVRDGDWEALENQAQVSLLLHLPVEGRKRIKGGIDFHCCASSCPNKPVVPSAASMWSHNQLSFSQDFLS